MSNRPLELFHSNNENNQRNRPKIHKHKNCLNEFDLNPFIKRTIIKVNNVVGYVNSINKSKRNTREKRRYGEKMKWKCVG